MTGRTAGVPLSSAGGPGPSPASVELPSVEACAACGSLDALLELLAAVCRCSALARHARSEAELRSLIDELLEQARRIAP